MKLINLILLLLPLTGFSQVKMLRSIDSLTANYHSLHLASNDTFKIVDEFECKGNRYTLHTNGWVKDSVIPKKFINVDTSFTISVKDMESPWVKIDSIPVATFQSVWKSPWYGLPTYSTETKKGTVELPIQVMDSGIKVEVVETRDTVYHCPYNHITYFVYNGDTIVKDDFTSCTQQKVITTRRYKLYIINEYGQKEYLSMELTKQK